MAIGLAAILFSIRMVRSRGWNFKYLFFWIAQAALLGGAGYMEYHVQRHGDQAVLAYSVMGACLIGFVAVTVAIWCLAAKAEQFYAKSDDQW